MFLLGLLRSEPAVLAVAVLALADDTNDPPGIGMNAFVLSLTITVLPKAFGYNIGADMNPARDLGPRLACLAVSYGSEIFKNGYRVYGPWASTICGAIFGAFLSDAAIFVGGESPVNYPKRRIRRSEHKWKKRWGARLRRTRRRLGGGAVKGYAGSEGGGNMNGETL
jgi:aquaglyceroporin related protein